MDGGYSDSSFTDFLPSGFSTLLVISFPCSQMFLFINNKVSFESLHGFAILSLQVHTTLECHCFPCIEMHKEKEKITDKTAIFQRSH